jgi:hypothetical protein
MEGFIKREFSCHNWNGNITTVIRFTSPELQKFVHSPIIGTLRPVASTVALVSRYVHIHFVKRFADLSRNAGAVHAAIMHS